MTLPAHRRDGISDSTRFWDCHWVFSGNAKTKAQKDLVAGIMELAEATQLALPYGLKNTLDALFYYRNEMFHCGFEWPKEECLRFAQRVKEQKWENWLQWSQHGDEPWIFYMSDEFIEHCLKMLDKVLDAFGRHCKDRLPAIPIPVDGFPFQ